MLVETESRETRTVAEVAKELRLHPATIYKKVAAGELPAIKTGGGRSAVRIPADYQERLVSQGGQS
jgi:excisionase family DNA binding protein